MASEAISEHLNFSWESMPQDAPSICLWTLVLHLGNATITYVCIYVAVSDRNRTLFCCVFRSHYCIWSAVTQYFCYRWDSYMVCKLMNTWYVNIAHISPTLYGSSALQYFKHDNVIEICNRVMFDFYPRLPHIYIIYTCTAIEWLAFLLLIHQW